MNLVRVGDKKWRGLGVRRIVVMVTDDKTDDKRRERWREINWWINYAIFGFRRSPSAFGVMAVEEGSRVSGFSEGE